MAGMSTEISYGRDSDSFTDKLFCHHRDMFGMYGKQEKGFLASQGAKRLKKLGRNV